MPAYDEYGQPYEYPRDCDLLQEPLDRGEQQIRAALERARIKQEAEVQRLQEEQGKPEPSEHGLEANWPEWVQAMKAAGRLRG